jgi:2,4-dienoyl-CoA reductase-like NADH-dependent reductase (Old Yellow Enzyme family)
MRDLLFEPLRLRGVELPNRVALSPMCQYSAEDGLPSDWHLRHYAERAIGGAGLVVVEATAVLPEGRITPGDLGIWDDEHAEALGKIARTIKTCGAVAGIQIAHAGRKASTARPWEGGAWLPPNEGGWATAAPSALAFGAYAAPKALDEKGIGAVIAAFAAAARRAVAAGFDLVELHSAHGYLLHQFLSPLSNLRADRYGGSLEGRMRLPLEVAAAVRGALPDSMPMFIRISATDWMEGGWDIEGSVEYARALKALGVDLVDASSGGLIADAKPTVGPMYQAPFARAIRERSGIKTGAVGMITEIGEARSIVEDGMADIVSLGRLLLRDPYWPIRNAPPDRRRSPSQYLRAFPSQ